MKTGHGGEMPFDVVSRKEQLWVPYGQEMPESTQPLANDLPLELRLVHHFVAKIFLPKVGKFEHVNDKELFFLWAFLTNTHIDIPSYILSNMNHASLSFSKNLPYGMLLTKIF